MNDRRRPDRHVDPLLTLDVTLVDQLAEVLQLRQELEPDPERDQAIRQLRMIRNHLVHQVELTVTSVEARAAMTLVLGHLLQINAGSLGDARCLPLRRRTSAATVSEILTRAGSVEPSRSSRRKPRTGQQQPWSSGEPTAGSTTGPCPAEALEQVRWFDDEHDANQQAREVLRRISDDDHDVATVWASLGLVLWRTGRPDEAINVLRRAGEIFRETGDRRGEGTAWTNLGNALRETHRFDEAIAAYDCAIVILVECGDRQGQARILNNLGRVHAALNNREQARRAWTAAAKLYTTAGAESDVHVCQAGARGSAKRGGEQTRALLIDRATTDEDGRVRQAAVRALAAGWADEQTRALLTDRATTDEDGRVRQAAVRALAAGWADEQTRALLTDRATTDEDGRVRQAAVEGLAAR